MLRRNVPAVALWIALGVVGSIGAVDAALAPVPALAKPDFIDTVFASRAVVVSIRIAIIFAALFVVLSVVALIARKQWLTRVGPVEVGKVAGLDAGIQLLDEELEAARQTIESLRREAVCTRQLIERKQADD